MKKLIIICLLMIFTGLSIHFCTAYPDHREGSLTTNTKSSAFSNDQEKVSFLRKYLKLPTEVVSTEFHIIYQDNSSAGVPGPSDWDMRVAVKVNKDVIKKWTEGFEESTKQEINPDWWKELPLESLKWKRDSTPRFYKRPGERAYLIVYIDEGIVLKRVTAMAP